ncbi:hypothetical protein EDF24_3736 [Curtobacterium sp. PhB130]|uniref:hypothetical protein n=1 Tax=unclassified Curtobacterium TaxID=257496 RepID=UPI000F4CE466|nr:MULTISPECIES: hypothetical protein [unclassified Curtobacterium]ROS71878.1 hypothetical protein EDF24_3736 [Curtobacterium sp. PhB130]TCK58267.1 hypothetical protein EDF27_3878 [Curtobacterium sp. PhB136]
MTRTPSDPAGLGDFIPERDGHALILGAAAGSEAVGWCFANAPGADIVVLADLSARLTGPRITTTPDPADWDELLERTLGEVARRYSTALTSVQARRLYVVIDLGPLLSTPPALPEPGRQLLLERLDELVQIGRAAAVHVLAIATDPAVGHRVSSRVRNTARIFRDPRSNA